MKPITSAITSGITYTPALNYSVGPTTYDVVWDNLSANISAVGPVLTRGSPGTGWGEYAYSNTSFLNTAVEFTMRMNAVIGHFSLGEIPLGTFTPGAVGSYESGYTVGSFDGSGTTIWVFEGPTSTDYTATVSYTGTDVLSIHVTAGGVVTARKNGTTFHTFTTPATGKTLQPIGGPYADGAVLNITAKVIY